jgi:Xaa-Pro dipeptidase
MATEHLTLFIPPVDPESVIWSGLPVSVEEAKERYDVDSVETTPTINSHLTSSSTPKSAIYAIADQVSTSTTFLEFENKDFELLKEAIEECRVIKDEYELALIRKANKISTEAHVAVVKAARHAKNERELQAIFLERCIALGCREQAYSGIFASGTNAATLHYVHNNQPLEGQLNLLLDAAGEYDCYAADITRTFPISGKFTKESQAIYEIVLKMQKDCLAMMKEGVQWEDVHITAHKIAIKGLLDLGILHNGSEDEIFKAKTSVGFFPHGLGHYLGMDTHDTGGHPNYADEDPMFRYLRMRGKLPAGSVITVEPGVYFCKFILEPYLKDEVHGKYIDSSVLEKYWAVGGVRIEDNILITSNGIENLTDTPKELKEIEALASS